LKLIEKDIPKIREDEVLIKIGACGVCGSDIHMAESSDDGYMIFAGHAKFPCVIGHEFAGEIVEIGGKVYGLEEGDIVAPEGMNWCGVCDSCRRGLFNQCQNLQEFGFTIDGAFAEYVAVKGKYCYKINSFRNIFKDTKDIYMAGAAIEPAAVSYNAIFSQAGGFLPGSIVAVFGAGPIGLTAIALAKIGGASKVIAVELNEFRLNKAKEFGADFILNPVELQKAKLNLVEHLSDITGGCGINIAVETTGVPHKIMGTIVDSMAFGSKIVQIGLTSELTEISLVKLQQKGIHLHGGIGHAGYGNFQNVINLVAAKKFEILRLISSKYNFDNVIDAINHAHSLNEAKIMVLL
ncbi:MAG: alcohol dehydrogenase catalytic domain-containing protein, partial [Nitrososphaeraceae archaeon]|nr:alcohol dehydrogenase catalytic domain-containing protein [Nitrososphaeraceae archaeon]